MEGKYYLQQAPKIEGIEIVDFIGKGGMSYVYKGRQSRLDRLVAVKVLASGTNLSEESLLRFQREAKATSMLDHPHIVQTIAAGVTPNDGRPYLVMEYLEGETLAEDFEKNGRFSFRKFKDVFLPVLAALSKAHEEGIVHRDIKPGNIMICHGDDGRDTVKVLDFGIAKLLDAPEGADKKLTKTDVLVGSPRYMSPEQIAGESLDGRSDLYSLACVMYESLTGEPPYSGNSAFEVIQKHVSAAPPTVSEWTGRLDIRKGLAKVTLWAMAKSPTQRPQSAAEFREHLNEVLESITLDRVPNVKTAKDGRSAQVKMVATAALLVGVLVFGVLSLPKSPTKSKIDSQLEDFERNANGAKGIGVEKLVLDAEALCAAIASLPDSAKRTTQLRTLWVVFHSNAITNQQKTSAELLALKSKVLQLILSSNYKEHVSAGLLFQSILKDSDSAIKDDLSNSDLELIVEMMSSCLEQMPVRFTNAQMESIDRLREICEDRKQLPGAVERLARASLLRATGDQVVEWKSRLSLAISLTNPEESARLLEELLSDKKIPSDIAYKSQQRLGKNYLHRRLYKQAYDYAEQMLVHSEGNQAIQMNLVKLSAQIHLRMQRREIDKTVNLILKALSERSPILNWSWADSLDAFIALELREPAMNLLQTTYPNVQRTHLVLSREIWSRCHESESAMTDPEMKKLIRKIIAECTKE